MRCSFLEQCATYDDGEFCQQTFPSSENFAELCEYFYKTNKKDRKIVIDMTREQNPIDRC